MSLRCFIGTKSETGRIRGIYCHNGGKIDVIGVILLNNYKNIGKIRELLTLGDISVLGKYINPKTKSHSFDNREEDVTVAYCRDRGEELSGPSVFKDFETYTHLYSADFELTCIFDVVKKRWLFYNADLKEIFKLDAERNSLLNFKN